MEDQLGILISDGNERFSQLSKKKRDIDIFIHWMQSHPFASVFVDINDLFTL